MFPERVERMILDGRSTSSTLDLEDALLTERQETSIRLSTGPECKSRHIPSHTGPHY